MIKLLELRTEKRLSQRSVAKIVNISQSTYNNWENSRTQPSIEQLILLSNFFHVSIDYIVGNSDDYGLINLINENTSAELSILKLFNRLDDKEQSLLCAFLERILKDR